MMKRITITAVAAAMLATATFGQANEAIEDVIGTQLQAFNDRDVCAKQYFMNSGEFYLVVDIRNGRRLHAK